MQVQEKIIKKVREKQHLRRITASTEAGDVPSVELPQVMLLCNSIKHIKNIKHCTERAVVAKSSPGGRGPQFSGK